MNDGIQSLRYGSQGAVIVLEKIRTSVFFIRSGTERIVKAQMGISQEKDSDYIHSVILRSFSSVTKEEFPKHSATDRFSARRRFISDDRIRILSKV